MSARGQASVELLGALPAILLTGLIVFQLLALGYSKVLAGNAAEAAALAAAGGGDVRPAARAAVPGWSRARMRVESRRGGYGCGCGRRPRCARSPAPSRSRRPRR